MKRCFKKILIILIVFIIMFEFVCSSTVNAENLINEENINAITNLAGGLVSIITWRHRLMITCFVFIMNQVMRGVAESEGVMDDIRYKDDLYLTPYDIFFDEYKLTGINFFDIEEINTESFVYKFRTSVAMWFYILRTLASAILLCILIYVGIRMALSSVAEDKARYKKMFFDWVCSLALIFLLQYLAIGIIYLNESIVSVLKRNSKSRRYNRPNE